MSNLILFEGIPTKSGVSSMAAGIIDSILSGESNPIEGYIKIKALEDLLKEVKANDRVKDYVLKEIERHGKTAEIAGCKVTISERTTYDYTQDELWLQYQTDIDRLKLLQKNREELVKAASKKMTAIPDENGEIVHPAGSQTTQVITVTFSK